MKLELVPVFELEYFHPKIKAPSHPYTTNEYDHYLDKLYKMSGFPDKLTPIAQGYNLYSVEEISEENLIKIIKDSLLSKKENLPGGYALCEIDQVRKPILTHRCCSDFNDINSWLNLANKNRQGFWIGHPMLTCEIQDNQIRFIEEENEGLKDIIISFADYQIATQHLTEKLAFIRNRIQFIAKNHQLNPKKVNQFIQFTLKNHSPI